MTDFITMVEVSPRDGLQNEPQTLSVQVRTELIKPLTLCGVPVIEAGSFVSPKWVPQMANSADVLRCLKTKSATRYPVLVPNLRGFADANAGGNR